MSGIISGFTVEDNKQIYIQKKHSNSKHANKIKQRTKKFIIHRSLFQIFRRFFSEKGLTTEYCSLCVRE